MGVAVRGPGAAPIGLAGVRLPGCPAFRGWHTLFRTAGSPAAMSGHCGAAPGTSIPPGARFDQNPRIPQKPGRRLTRTPPGYPWVVPRLENVPRPPRPAPPRRPRHQPLMDGNWGPRPQKTNGQTHHPGASSPLRILKTKNRLACRLMVARFGLVRTALRAHIPPRWNICMGGEIWPQFPPFCVGYFRTIVIVKKSF